MVLTEPVHFFLDGLDYIPNNLLGVLVKMAPDLNPCKTEQNNLFKKKTSVFH